MYLCTRLILPFTAAQLLSKQSPTLSPAGRRMSGSREVGCSPAPHATHLATSNMRFLPVPDVTIAPPLGTGDLVTQKAQG